MCTGEGCIRFKMFMTDYHLIIRISDNGAGMDEDTLESLREKAGQSSRGEAWKWKKLEKQKAEQRHRDRAL